MNGNRLNFRNKSSSWDSNDWNFPLKTTETQILYNVAKWCSKQKDYWWNGVDKDVILIIEYSHYMISLFQRRIINR